jgi:zinc finger SWIM domain-containing protein 3
MIPEVGMIFESEEKAYEMYNTYVGKKDFSIKKGHSKHGQDRDHTLAQKYFNCTCEGFGKNKSTQNTIRTGCEGVSSYWL